MNEIQSGKGFPIGATVTDTGVNFCLFSKNAHGVDLMLFDDPEAITPVQVITLDPKKNRTYHYWHVLVKGLMPGNCTVIASAAPTTQVVDIVLIRSTYYLIPMGRL